MVYGGGENLKVCLIEVLENTIEQSYTATLYLLHCRRTCTLIKPYNKLYAYELS